MGRVNVWIPDDLHDAAKAAGLNISAAAQYGIRVKLGNAERIREHAAAPQQQEEEPSPPEIRCTEFRHTGPYKRFDWGTQCQGCKQAVR